VISLLFALLPLLLPVLVVIRWVHGGWQPLPAEGEALSYDFARHELGGVPVELLAEALAGAGRMMTSDVRDWSLSPSDVWLYGLLVGWECERRHEHDEVCGGNAALREVAERHRWRAEDVERLRSHRSAVAAITAPPRPLRLPPSLTAQQLADFARDLACARMHTNFALRQEEL
jgi:hypothetical protein